MSLSKEDIKEIYDGYSEAHHELNSVILLMLPFCGSLEAENRVAYDYAFYGVVRRIYIIKRCLNNFERISPPEKNEYLDDDLRSDLTLFLHAFLLHISGGIDNLAWVWFYTQKIDEKTDPEKFKGNINLFNKKFQKYLHKDIIDKCSEFNTWYNYLKNYRDPIAHRVPPYIIPYTVDPKNETEHRMLIVHLNSVIDEEDKINIQKKLNLLRDYEPRYLHSFIQDKEIVRFHPQAIVDTRTFCELAKSVFVCLAAKFES
ncbi:MAG: hypothetical protein NT178_13860 [Proteobacteria bacterium]|nr:hypothetical protein [Pseudomonadota bacterium]